DWNAPATAWASSRQTEWRPRRRENQGTGSSRPRPNATAAAPAAGEEHLTATAELELPFPPSTTQNADPAAETTEAQGELQETAGAADGAGSQKEPEPLHAVEPNGPAEPVPAPPELEQPDPAPQ
ncbi:unnamed protein product, partial [Cladocopium goreaui]